MYMILSMRHSTQPLHSLDYILGGGVVGVGRGTKTNSDVKDVTTASEDVITVEDGTMSDDVTMPEEVLMYGQCQCHCSVGR